MKQFKKAIWIGFLVWLIPFIISVIIYPLRSSNYGLFESIMAIIILLTGVGFGVSFAKHEDKHGLIDNLAIGILWIAISLILDLFMLVWGPAKMPVATYFSQIGLKYLFYPIVLISFELVKPKTKPVKTNDQAEG